MRVAAALGRWPDGGKFPGQAGARGGRALDHRAISAKEQRLIKTRTDRILDRRGISARQAKRASATVPVYVHVMAATSGEGDVTDAQIADQIDVLNATFAGAESGDAADTGFSFTLAGTDRFYNNTWHRDGASSKYRKLTSTVVRCATFTAGSVMLGR